MEQERRNGNDGGRKDNEEKMVIAPPYYRFFFDVYGCCFDENDERDIRAMKMLIVAAEG